MKKIAGKLALIVILAGITIFAAASISLAGEGFRGAIHGKYAFTGTGSCLFAASGFTTDASGNILPNDIFPRPYYSVSTSAWEGVYEFEKDGKGTVTATLHTVASGNNTLVFPDGFPKASKSDLFFEFDYDLSEGGKINFTTVDGVKGCATCLPFLSSGPQKGVIADNGKTILVTCGAPVQLKQPPTAPADNMICNVSFVLSWIGD